MILILISYITFQLKGDIVIEKGPLFPAGDATVDNYMKIESPMPFRDGSPTYPIHDQCQVDKIVVK